MPDTHDVDTPLPESPDRSMTRHYVSVLVVEAVIILLLWMLSRAY
jgi:hypothetical protein